MIIGVLVVALAYFVADKFWLQAAGSDRPAQAAGQGSATSGPRSIAVLPLVNMSSDAENEYFADGLSEELLNMLARISELQVAGRTSSFAFKGQNQDLRGIAEKLNVDTILEGSVRKDDARQRVRITLQLINAADGYHLWSETYDRGLDDIFAIQEEIAHEVAKAMRVTLLGDDERRLAEQERTDLTAYELYLQGLQQFNDFSYASLREAERLFSQALERDPGYTPAQLKLAGTRIEMATTGALPLAVATELATPAIRQVLAESPDNSEAHTLMAAVHRLNRRNRDVVRELESALSANPKNVEALREMGRQRFDMGQIRAGLDMLEEAERMDPYSVPALWDLVFTHGALQKPEQAEAYANRIGAIQPDNPMQFYGPAFAWKWDGDLPRSMALLKQSYELDPNDPENPAEIAADWVELGDVAQAEAWVRRAESIDADSPLVVASRVAIHLYREQDTQAADLSQRAMMDKLDNRQGSESVFRRVFITQLVRTNRLEEALAWYRDDLPEAFEQPIGLDRELPFQAQKVAELALLLRMRDPMSEQAASLIEIAEAQASVREPELLPFARSFDRAVIEMARGDKASAIAYLVEAWDKRLRFNWLDIDQRFVFDAIRDEPEYQRLMAMVDDWRESERERAYELVGVIGD
jgi:TolB-like protein/tetratricopeptide (TPR) repeat protein